MLREHACSRACTRIQSSFWRTIWPLQCVSLVSQQAGSACDKLGSQLLFWLLLMVLLLQLTHTFALTAERSDQHLDAEHEQT